MNREAHVRFCERLRGRFPRSTRLVILTDRNPDIPLLRLKKELKEMGLELNGDKTKVVSAETGNFEFLGFNFRRIWNKKKTRKFPLMRPSHKAVMSIKARIREITIKRPVKVTQVINELNPVLRGWMNYFRVGNSGRTLSKVQQYAVKRIRLFIRKNKGRTGYGWKEFPNEYLYDKLGLYKNVRVNWMPTRV